MIDFQTKDKYAVEDLEKLIALLRSDDGCPWDREQNHESIKRNFLEETYEAVEAIESKNPDLLKEELGDVLTQVVFHSRIEEECGNFDFEDVCDAVCKKLIYRHPHVFGDLSVSSSAEVLSNWDELKKKEKAQETVASAMSAVAKSLPALWRAEKIQQKAAKTGFGRENISSALDKLYKEIGELKESVENGCNATEKLGDLFFSAVNIARFLEADPELCLHRSCDKFTRRFMHVEAQAREQGRGLHSMSLSEMDELYNAAKQME